MSNFNVGDVVVDLTNMDKWRDSKEFKSELFLYDFNKKVLDADEANFIIKSGHENNHYPVFLPDYELFSQSTGLNVDKSRVLFNLTPHMSGLGTVFRKNKTQEELSLLKPAIAMETDEDMKRFIISLKDAFLTYFDSIHEEIKPQIS